MTTWETHGENEVSFGLEWDVGAEAWVKTGQRKEVM